MALIEQEKIQREQLNRYLNEIKDIQPSSLVQTERLGSDLNFESGLLYFERGLNLFHMLEDLDLDRVPYDSLLRLNEVSSEITTYVNSIRTFKPTDSNPVSSRDTYIANFRDRYDHWFNTVAPIIAFCIRRGTDFDVLQREARDALTQLAAAKQETEDRSKALLSDAQSTLNTIRQAAAEVGVAQHATHFNQEAEHYKTTSKYWLIALIVTAFLTSAWGYFSFHLLESPSQEIQNQTIYLTKVFSSRIAVLMTLIFMLVWCSKNYAAHSHNFIINRHRQNALNTFETFVKAAGDDSQTKNAVLLQTTQSIFSSQPSGYITRDTEQDSSNKVIEIFKDITK